MKILMSNITACPLDCYDACEIVYENDKITAKKNGYTNGFLCPHLNHYQKSKHITKPSYNGVEISLDEALDKLKEIIKTTAKEKTLFYKSSGNFGLMQDVTGHFFASHGAVLTDGNLCDGAGEAGIIQGRGSNKNMSLSEIAKSDVVIIWGRNPHTTSSHLLPLIKGKTLIVIDPVKTKIAKIADIHIQLKPHTDMQLAMFLSRFLHIEGSCDEEYLKKYASEYEDFYDLSQTLRIKKTLDKIDVSLGQIGDVLKLIKNKKIAIVCGIGIQKYRNGADVMRCIDAFAVNLSLFANTGCGVAYLGNSKEGIKSPFNLKAKKVSKVNTEFSKFDTIFIQGANPLSQMPDTLRVEKEVKEVKNIVYFGTEENESSQLANLVIPAKNFLSKNDVRVSYAQTQMSFMPMVKESSYGISEYDLSAFLCKEFGVELKKEVEYLKYFKKFEKREVEELPYKDGFDTDDKEFLFLQDLELPKIKSNAIYLITPKSPKSLNSQFNRDDKVYLPSAMGYKTDEIVNVSSINGSVKLKVEVNDDLRDDCVLIYSGTKGVNNLTSSLHSYDGKNAIYQENRVEINR
jgi:anaerobic selenocysteine-containing dehydrogenase